MYIADERLMDVRERYDLEDIEAIASRTRTLSVRPRQVPSGVVPTLVALCPSSSR